MRPPKPPTSQVVELPTMRVAIAVRWEEAWAWIKVMDRNRILARIRPLNTQERTAAQMAEARYDHATHVLKVLTILEKP